MNRAELRALYIDMLKNRLKYRWEGDRLVFADELSQYNFSMYNKYNKDHLLKYFIKETKEA